VPGHRHQPRTYLAASRYRPRGTPDQGHPLMAGTPRPGLFPPARPRPATRDQRGPRRRRVPQPGQRGHLRRNGRRHRHQPPRRAGMARACGSSALVCVRHPHGRGTSWPVSGGPAGWPLRTNAAWPLFWARVAPPARSGSTRAAASACAGPGRRPPGRVGDTGRRAGPAVDVAEHFLEVAGPLGAQVSGELAGLVTSRDRHAQFARSLPCCW